MGGATLHSYPESACASLDNSGADENIQRLGSLAGPVRAIVVAVTQEEPLSPKMALLLLGRAGALVLSVCVIP